MYPAKPFSTKVLMSALTGFQSFSAVLGNGSILTVIARCKSLRTLSNVLIANLSLVDMLNTVINMPLHLISVILEITWFRGKALAIITSFFNRLFIVLNLASMLALMVNMYFAIGFHLKYLAWKTNKKAVVCCCLIWVVCTLMVILVSIPLYGIDLGDAHVIDYRAEIYKQSKYFVAGFMAVFVICGGLVGILTIRSIKKKKTKREEMTVGAIQAQARTQNYIQATKTVAMIVAAYFISYVPAIAYAVIGQKLTGQANSWFAFVAWAATFFSSVVNPIIYFVRTRRFRSAFKQFLKDPFGSSNLKDKQTGPGKRERKGNLGSVASNENGADSESKNQERYLHNRRNGIRVLATEAPQVDHHVLEDTKSSFDGRRKLRRAEDLGSIPTHLSNTVSMNLFSQEIQSREAWALKTGGMIAVDKKKKPPEGTALEVDDEEASSQNGSEGEPRIATHFTFRRNTHSRRDTNLVKSQHHPDETGGVCSNSLLEDDPKPGKYPVRVKGMTTPKKPFEETEVEQADESEEVSRTIGHGNESGEGQRLSSRKKRNSQERTDPERTAGLPSQEIEESYPNYKPEEREQSLESSGHNALPSVCI